MLNSYRFTIRQIVRVDVHVQPQVNAIFLRPICTNIPVDGPFHACEHVDKLDQAVRVDLDGGVTLDIQAARNDNRARREIGDG